MDRGVRATSVCYAICLGPQPLGHSVDEQAVEIWEFRCPDQRTPRQTTLGQAKATENHLRPGAGHDNVFRQDKIVDNREFP